MTTVKIKTVADPAYKYLAATSEIPVSIVDNEKAFSSREQTEKSSILTALDKENRTFLQDRYNEGVIDDLVSLIRIAWNNYNIGKLITIVEQSTRVYRESLEGVVSNDFK
jgi:hypothetical protein